MRLRAKEESRSGGEEYVRAKKAPRLPQLIRSIPPEYVQLCNILGICCPKYNHEVVNQEHIVQHDAYVDWARFASTTLLSYVQALKRSKKTAERRLRQIALAEEAVQAEAQAAVTWYQ